MSGFAPTHEQLAIVAAAKDTKDNLIISALAGAAKTSTLVLIANALRGTPILCLAFNKKNALDMQERLPGNCEAMTLNSLGHRTWARFIGQRINLDANKTHRLLSAMLSDLKPDEQEWAYENMADIMRAINQGKTAGYIPTGKYPLAKRLLNDDEFFGSLDEEPTKLMEDLIRAVTLQSIDEAYKGIIDFNDQILLPTVFPATFDTYPLIMVDEAQDLSALNHATLKKLVKKRLIAVGDECQAIYGFRGAHGDSMFAMQQAFDMTKLQLSISFRCPISVVEEARWRAPHMLYPDWAKQGSVEHYHLWNEDNISDDTVILCRNNAPLFSMAVKLLKAGRYPELVGNDIGKALVKVMKKFGKPSISRAKALEELDSWVIERLKRSRDEGKIHDQADCIRIFLRQGKTLGEALAYADRIMSVQGPIKLMTGHKSKGLEFNTVFILDQDLIGKEPQDKNLRYVMQTRSKNSLVYVQSEHFEEQDNAN